MEFITYEKRQTDTILAVRYVILLFISRLTNELYRGEGPFLKPFGLSPTRGEVTRALKKVFFDGDDLNLEIRHLLKCENLQAMVKKVKLGKGENVDRDLLKTQLDILADDFVSLFISYSLHSSLVDKNWNSRQNIYFFSDWREK